jgi:uncharacterized protein (DUF2236 family)
MEDVYLALLGPVEPARWERVYASASAFGTTLQVPAEAWPASRDAFEDYWRAETEKILVDEPVRRYLRDLADLRFLPAPFSVLFGRLNRFVTTGFLPPDFRDALGLPWNDADQRRFDRFIAAVRLVTRLQSPAVRRFPFNVFLWDIRRRIRTGRPLV